MRVSLPLSGARQSDRAIQVNSQRSINWYPSLEGDGAKSVLTMLPTPGLDRRIEFGNGPTRSNIVEFAGAAYWVSGSELMKMTTAESVSAVGSLNTNTGYCYLAAGRTYLMVTDGGDGYTWNDTTFAAISDGDFPTNPSYCGYLDGFFLVLDAGTDQWNKSASENPTSWDALEFASAEASPDDAVAIVTTYRDLYIIGTLTTQVYYNSGNPQFPFDLYANGVLEFGTPAPASVTKTGGNIFMLAQVEGGGITVLRINGFQAQRISDPDIAYTLSRMTTITDAEGYAYTEADQTFYVLTFPSEDLTLTYHVEQGQWHDRSSHGMGRHRSRGYGRFNGRHYVGDYQNAKLYALDPAKYTDDGQTIRRVRRGAVLHKDGLQFEVNEFEVEFARGKGLVDGQGSDPQAIFRYSYDGGNTWSNELWQPMGALGDYTRRAIWYRLGQMNDFRFELAVTDPIEAILIAAYADVTVLAA